jgi:hypothetical protein
MKSIFTSAFALVLGLGFLGCKASPAARAEAATAAIRQMDQEILDAQKQIIAKFKALPEADATRLDMGANFDDWAVSEKALAKNEENLEKTLINYQKDARDEALIGELRLYTKKIAKDCQENIPEYERRCADNKKAVEEGKITFKGITVPLNDKEKVDFANRIKVFAFQVEFLKAQQKIADAYEPKLAKLLG